MGKGSSDMHKQQCAYLSVVVWERQQRCTRSLLFVMIIDQRERERERSANPQKTLTERAVCLSFSPTPFRPFPTTSFNYQNLVPKSLIDLAVQAVCLTVSDTDRLARGKKLVSVFIRLESLSRPWDPPGRFFYGIFP